VIIRETFRRCRGQRVRGHLLAAKRRHELREQQGVAARRFATGAGECLVRRRPQALLDEPRDCFIAQRARPDASGSGLVRDLGEERLVGAGLRRPQPDEQQDRLAFEPPRQVGQEQERRPIAPVQVVHRQQEWALLGEVEDEPEQAVEGREGRAVPVVRTVGLRVAEHRGSRRGGIRQQGRAPPRRRQLGLEELPHDAEWEVALELAAARRQHAHPVLGAATRLSQQPALADPRGTLDNDQAAVPAHGPLDEGIELLQLAIAFEQSLQGHGRTMLCALRRTRSRSCRLNSGGVEAEYDE
jgi:hypothetical protein